MNRLKKPGWIDNVSFFSGLEPSSVAKFLTRLRLKGL